MKVFAHYMGNEIDSSNISFVNGENTVLSAKNPIILT